MVSRTTIAFQGQERGDHFFFHHLFFAETSFMRLCSIYSIFQKTKHSQVRFLKHSGKRFRLGMGTGFFVFWSKSIGFGAFFVYVLVLLTIAGS
jgi:hypothetical protein